MDSGVYEHVVWAWKRVNKFRQPWECVCMCAWDPGCVDGCEHDDLAMGVRKCVCKTRECDCVCVQVCQHRYTFGAYLPSSWKGTQHSSFTSGYLCTPPEPFPDLARSALVEGWDSPAEGCPPGSSQHQGWNHTLDLEYSSDPLFLVLGILAQRMISP